MLKRYKGIGVLDIPDNATPEQELAIINAAEEKLKPAPEKPGIGTQIGAMFAGIPAGIIKGTSSAVEGIGAIAGDEDLKQIGRGLRENSLSRYFTDVPQQQQGTIGREVGELAGPVQQPSQWALALLAGWVCQASPTPPSQAGRRARRPIARTLRRSNRTLPRVGPPLLPVHWARSQPSAFWVGWPQARAWSRRP
jgi:hypothetical protein